MSEPVTGVAYLSMDCYCRPPNRLTTNAEKTSDYCDVCGALILAGTGVITTKPRLQIVEVESEQ